MELGLKDKVVLITGINNPEGIGAATAFAFAAEGAKLVLAYKKVFHPYDEAKTGECGLDRYYKGNAGDTAVVEARLREMGAEFIVLERDISNENDVKYIFDRAIERFGKVDVLVNNAAMADEEGNDTIEKITSDVINMTLDVNMKGFLFMTREFVKRRGACGRIINLSTDAAQAFAGQITYGASKAAVEAFTRSIAVEVGKYGITVNSVAPGPTQTGYIDKDSENTLLSDIPLGKLIQPGDIADTIVFLASERAGQITGQVIKVDGGHAI